MAITNPNRVVKVSQLNYFKGKADALYQTKAIAAITGLSASTVEAALAELLGKINALPSAIVPKGSKAFAGLTPATDLAAANVGFMWNITDAFTTTSDFAEGSGHNIPAGANVYVANVGTAAEPSYKYDIFQGMYDLSGYALKSEMSVTPGEGANADKTTIQLKSGLTATVLTAHQDITGKADKDTDAVEGNIAEFDANGNPVDSGHALSEYKTKQTAVTDPTAGSDTDTLNFIATISQNANGEITATKQPVRSASASQSGLMSSAHYSKLEAIAYAENSDIDEMFA